MSRALEVFLKDSFEEVMRTFVEGFPRSYAAFKANDAAYEDNFAAFVKIIEVNCRGIYRHAAAGIARYLTLYNIHAETADEFKIIYYLGRAVERSLRDAGLGDMAQVQLYTVVGLLDFRIRTKGFHKPQLTKAITKLIKAQELDTELGSTGWYLIYKCVSTSQQKPVPGISGL